jgi:hypothetical protein
VKLAAAQRINLQRHLLVRLHPLQLRLFEVRRNPQVREGDDGEEVLPDAEVGADLDVLLVDDSGGGRGDVGVGQVQLGLVDLGLSGLDVSDGGVGFGLLGPYLVGTVLDGFGCLRTRLRELL